MSGFMTYAIGVVTLIGIYAIIAMILNLEAGWGGLWDLGVGGLMGAGAYFFVLATVAPDESLLWTPGWPMLLGIVGAGLFGALVSFLIGLPAIRLRGEYFLIVTFAFATMISQFLINEPDITNGTVGFTELARPFDGAVARGDYQYVLLAIVLAVVAVTYLVMRRLGRSPYGLALRSARDNEALALALGKNVTRRRLELRMLVGFMFGIIAPLYVWHIRALVPSMWGPDITFTAWTVIVVGGIGSIAGGIVGAIVLIGLTEALLFIPVSVEYADVLSATRPFLLGVALIIVLRLRPDGLISERWTFAWRGEGAKTVKDRLGAVIGTTPTQEGNA
jgi:branched-chain amino acid transport system permease protein